MKMIRIYGVGRSGSTVIGAYMAGRFQNAVHIGEAFRFDTPILIQSLPFCTCGSGLDECTFWRTVTKTSYTAVLASLSSSDIVVVDSSKAGELPKQYASKAFSIHLVKDPRATTWSWLRKRETVNPLGKKEHLKRISFREIPLVVLSNYKNFIKFRMRRYMYLDYGAFVDNPTRYLQKISEEFGLGPIREHFDPTSNHGVGGNIARYRFDGVLKFEDGWKKEAGMIYKLLITAAYVPILVWMAILKSRTK